MRDENRHTNEELRKNSFEGRHGGTGTNFKIYFDNQDELKKGIDNVVEGKRYVQEQLAIIARTVEDK